MLVYKFLTRGAHNTVLNMATQLVSCTDIEQRSVIRFLMAEGIKPIEIFRRMTLVYGEKCFSQRSVYDWVERFKKGRTSVEDLDRSGRPASTVTLTNIKKVNALIESNRRIKISEIATELAVSYGSVFSIIHDNLKMNKVCARWVPKMLNEYQKQQRVEICTKLLKRYEEEGDAFLERIVTGDETWVHHYEPESKQQSKQWRHFDSPPPKKFKTQRSAGKILMTIFWDIQGPLIIHYQENKETVNSQRYSEMLEEELKPAIRTKRRGMLTKGVLLQHDNARPHTANLTIETIKSLGFEVLPHPPYSPDHGPSDYYLFGLMKKAQKGQKFSSDLELKESVQNWLGNQPKDFYKKGIYKLIDRWKECILMQGSYFEK